MKRQIVNIINFIRGCEPRCEADLLTPVKEQVKLVNKYGLPSTFLLMYDALIKDEFRAALAAANGKTEIGLWLELCEPLCEAAGVKWRGRFAWDWFANAGFTIAYNDTDREKLVDAAFEAFKKYYGKYPRTVGSWALDAHSCEYMDKKYKITAACICRDQWGTDGYSLWGGYYNQAYYPCRNNMFCPAQTEKEQINFPVFRMLGSDPIYQYDFGLDIGSGAAAWQGVATLEPVYCGEDGGGNKDWVDWYFAENFSGRCVSFGYTQAGQENSFGWPAMCSGLTYQIGKIAALVKENKLEALTLADTGEWFRQNFKTTPPTSVTALTDRHKEGRSSVWYDCKNYRVNIYTERGKFHIRDLHLFREDYAERYKGKVNDLPAMVFDNLPYIDGNRFSGGGVRSGLYPQLNGKDLSYKTLGYEEDENSVTVTFYGTEAGDFVIRADERSVTFSAESDFTLVNKTRGAECEPQRKASADTLKMRYNGFDYRVDIEKGGFADEMTAVSENGTVRIILDK